MMKRNRTMKNALFFLSVAVLSMTGCAAIQGGAVSATNQPARTEKTGEILNPALSEVSGLARSACSPELFWAHNDSGDEPRLYLIDLHGELRATLRLSGVKAKDWEDITSATFDGRSFLFVGDFGDNNQKRDHVRIYVLEDPCMEEGALDRNEWPILNTLKVQYDDGPHNAEALGVDPLAGDLYIITKTSIGSCGVYRLPASAWRESSKGVQVAQRVGTLPWSKVTGMDIATDGSKAVVLTYGNAYEYSRKAESWAEAFAGVPVEIVLPYREQGEAVCYDGDGRRLILTSEKIPAPIWVVDLDEAGRSAPE